jgi:hypothetical protein
VPELQPHHAENAALPTVTDVYESAAAEHTEFLDMPEDALKAVIEGALTRVLSFEEAARQPLTISPEAAEDIDTIWVLSGTGTYDAPFKPQDNPLLFGIPWMGGFDRARIGHAARIARKIAELRSGQQLEAGSLGGLESRKEATKEMIAEYGPNIVYNGYRSETEFAERLFDRPGMIIPKERVKIIHDDLHVTADQIRTFEYPNDPESKNKGVAIISHAAHVGARVMHMLSHYRPFTEGTVPYIAPLPTPDAGRRDYALMEARGLLYYVFLRQQAAVKPHQYQLLQ